MLKKLIILLALLTIVSGCASTATSQHDANTVNMQDLAGKTVNIADFKGEKVYIKFWASWCPICLAGLSEVTTLATQDHDFEVITVVAPGYNNEKQTDDFIKWFSDVQHVENLPVWLNEGGNVVEEFNVKGYPTSAFLNTKGELVRSQPGHLSNDQIIEAMNEID
ncbi:thioredoxin [Sporosarcina sp. PTS2304]|uniref:redoxin family protein n=1 Tax=Sporosarcina sp. PTS2304 TaxID=2283194 RepID=UPI000E0CDF6A|nr:redoxin family protein [Sporosarcina sp. PTS2304]AXH99355.1 thioredoxin [Sporosarcina sp. PTS2304]